MDAGQIIYMIVITLLVLTALIVVHELGHYFVAKKRGIKVSEFAVGFGPRLIKWHRKETEFSIRPIFIGGFVRFADDEEKDPVPGDFRAASLKSRALTIIAGPAMNVVAAVIISIVVLTAFGDYYPTVAELEQGSPAMEAGLQEGDIITDINGIHMDFASYDWQTYAESAQGESLPMTILREGETLEFDVPYREELNEQGRKAVGFSVGTAPKSFNFFEAIALSFKWLFMMIKEMLAVLGSLFLGRGIENLSGIVGIATAIGGATTMSATMGMAYILKLMAMISVNLAIINLIPIPALDGGKLVLYGIEGIRRKPAPMKVEGILNLIGFTLIIGLAIFLVFQDVTRLVT